MQKLMASRKQRHKFSKLLIFPLIDCVFLVLIFFIFIAVSESFKPIRAVPLYNYIHGSPARNYAYGKVFVKIDNPTDSNNMGRMDLKPGSIPKFYMDIKYDEMLSHLQDLPDEYKEMLLISSGRDVHHQQIIRVMDIGHAAGIGKVGFRRDFPILIKKRKVELQLPLPQADEMLNVEEIKVVPRVGPSPQTR